LRGRENLVGSSGDGMCCWLWERRLPRLRSAQHFRVCWNRQRSVGPPRRRLCLRNRLRARL